MARYGCTITVAAGKIPSSQSNFSWVATEDNFPTAAIDGGLTSILNGGGNLRCYTDSTKGTPIAVEVVEFVTGGTPSVVIWGISPTLAVASTVYIEADTVATAQPIESSTYGSEKVWVAFEAVLHMGETGTNGVFTDSTGNGHDTTITLGSTLGTTSAGNPLGGNWPDFTQSQGLSLASSHALVNNTAFTISCWFNADTNVQAGALVGSRYKLPSDTQWAGIQAAGAVFSKAATTENLISTTTTYNTTQLIKMKQSTASLDKVLDGATVAQELTVVDGESINNTVTANNFRIGTYYDSGSIRNYNGRIGEVRIKSSKDTADYDTSEYNNQSTPSTFWTTGAWEDQDASITIIESTGTLNLSTQNPTIEFTGTITVEESTSTLNTTSQSPTITFTATLTIVESTQTINLTGFDPTITLTPPSTLVVVESTQSIDWTTQSPNITLSGTLTIEESTQTIDILTRRPVIQLGVPTYTQIFTGIEKSYEFTGTIKSYGFTGIIATSQIFSGTEKAATFSGVKQ